MRIGELFAGYGGLGMGVQAVLGGTVAWHSEFDPAPSKVLAHHHPDVPNHGDITAVDWSAVEPVDVLTGGFPCQDLSHAGKRAGLRPDTRSGLWTHMAYAIDQLRPPLVVIENVRGLLSATAHSDMEPCPWCLGDAGDESALRALGAVLGDLADIGYDATWLGVSASDAGAPHGRFRVFVVACHADAPLAERGGPQPEHLCAAIGPAAEPGERAGDAAHAQSDGRDEGWPEPARLERGPDATQRGAVDWGAYAPAIARWERVLGRPAPAPTEPGRNGGPRLSPAFVEWMMGLPAGHVTDPAIGLTRNQQLKALGNGVVPQQAALALSLILGLPSLPSLPSLPTPSTDDSFGSRGKNGFDRVPDADTDRAGRCQHRRAVAVRPEHAAAQHRRDAAPDAIGRGRHRRSLDPVR